MPISNLNNDHFTQGEMDTINKAWVDILAVLNGKTRNLRKSAKNMAAYRSRTNWWYKKHWITIPTSHI